MTTAFAPGIRNPERPGGWLVWPWPKGSDVATIVGHCLRRWPQASDSDAHHLAFYRGLLSAVDNGAAAGRCLRLDERWLANFRTSLTDSVTMYEARLIAEASSTPGRRPAGTARSAVPGRSRSPRP
jgi:hypothetical protein